MGRLMRVGWRGVSKVLALSFLLLAGHAGYQKPSAKAVPEADSFRISVDVALVVLDASVTDRQGNPVSTLGEQDFEVYEDGVRQSIRLFKNEDIPVTVGVLVDHSSTMRPKLVEVTAAARTFARSSNPDDEMFVVNFNEKVTLGLPRTNRFTSDTATLESAITTGMVGGQTALYDAIATGLEELRAGKRDKKALIVVSDGGDNASRHTLEQVMKLANESNAVIYTIGVFDADDPDRNPAVLKRLARATGGEAFFPEQVSETVDICQRIARDIRHQYTIGYAPAKLAGDGSYHAIRVVARAKGPDRLAVRTRAGYIATSRRKNAQ